MATLQSPVHQEEDIARAGRPVTEAGALPEEALPPDAVGGPDHRGHVGLIPPHQVGPGQERHSPGRAVTPVDQLIVPRFRILDLTSRSTDIISKQHYIMTGTSPMEHRKFPS